MSSAALLARAGLAIVVLNTATHAAVVLQPIAVSGTDGVYGPGQGAGVIFSNIDLHAPAINALGQVIFRGVENTGGDSQGVWKRSPWVMGNTRMAIAGGARPGGGAYPVGSVGVFANMLINSSGDFATRQGNNGVFGSVAGTPARVMLLGDAAPDTAGSGIATTFSGNTTGSPWMNNAGQVAFIGTLTNSTTSVPATTSAAPTANNSGLWVGPIGAPSLVLRQNDDVVGPTVRMGTFLNNTLSFNPSGRFVSGVNLQGTVTKGTGAGGNSTAILSNRTGLVGVIARAGDGAPDAAGVVSGTDLYRAFNTLSMGFNNAGRVAFVGSTRDAAGTQTAASALFTDLGTGTLRQVARAGTALPTFANAIGSEFAGATWASLSAAPMLNGNDVAVAVGVLGGAAPANTSLLLTVSNSGSSDVFTRIAKSGDEAFPGSGILFTTSAFAFSNQMINAAGQIVFTSSLTGTGVTTANDVGIFAFDPTGGMMLVAREGDVINVPGIGNKTIASFAVTASSGGEDGRTSSLASNGFFTFQAGFTDGTAGVIVTTIPAAGTLPLLGLAGLLAARRRR
jgi:hypothetical protein